MTSALPHLPLVDEAAEVKPTWRGWIHAVTFPLAIVAGVVLVVLADGAAAKASTTVFAITSLLLFGNSALYHRFNWQPKTKRILKRIDHANIFLLIAGTYTPIAALALPPGKDTLVLVAVWVAALLGIGFRVFWLDAPRWLYTPLYVLMGGAALLFTADIFAANAVTMTLVLVGGVAYTIGAVVYGLKRPNPVPGVFGFHEIFHALTLVAFACHWTGILLIAVNPPFNG
ncbi:PAQR family membrane homeostasis protein TrhA [Subtercola boreus]|uniref:Hemolysin III n=1 Tax=Subtercola boreus TaxID=120213 RepID=A0A3E0WB59_9MICO|nr:hemolysin III family protein [Subtercola boreus]RFA20032.1 hemolysin III [Subtercola boreus]RFA20161.1 hemolysin III [Subtercola boreus]RFA26488.1 hemolysin III [Subtercola boreus]